MKKFIYKAYIFTDFGYEKLEGKIIAPTTEKAKQLVGEMISAENAKMLALGGSKADIMYIYRISVFELE